MNKEPTGQTAADIASRAAPRVADSILADRRTLCLTSCPAPNPDVVVELLDCWRALLFPGFFGPRGLTVERLPKSVADVLGRFAILLEEQVQTALRYASEAGEGGPGNETACAAKARRVVAGVIDGIPAGRTAMSLDVQAAHDGDPAARHVDEIILCYPGVRALGTHRLAHELERRGVPLVPRIMAERAHAETGIDIHPGARVGRSFFIDHGTGVVIGETSIIGDHCKLYQGVTLGAKSFPRDERGRLRRGVQRHPTLEDHVTVYAGATILGGDTVIGAGSVINGGVFLTSSVPPGHVVRGPRFDITLRSNPELPPTMYNI